MNRIRGLCLCAFVFCTVLFFVPLLAANPPAAHVIRIDDAIINPITSEYITGAIERASGEGAACLVITLDTPGGLLDSTRSIVKSIMAAPIPVIVYVGPAGARAASAGVFITLASDIAAMAPTTHMGAAHPVTVGRDNRSLKKTARRLKGFFGLGSEKPAGEERDFMQEKITNDTVAWVRSIAEARGRNMKWAEHSVTESISSTEKEALDQGVINLVAANIPELLAQIDGRPVKRLRNERLQTAGARVLEFPLSKRQRILLVLTNPNIAYLLMMLGFYGLLFEVTHPGIGFPGIAGLISIILALYAFQTLPTNFAGMALIGLAVLLFIAETQAPSFGLLTLGGVVSMLLGSVMLIDSPHAFLQISLWVILPVVGSTALITFALVGMVVRAHRRKSALGEAGLVGEVGRTRFAFGPGMGKVDIHGEIWNAQSDQRLEKGEEVRVVNLERMKVKVEKLS